MHHFSLDPRSILGVGPDATPEEIHEAFREKSKKHHPDTGGDEWAFRMIVRSYEILKSGAGDSRVGRSGPGPFRGPGWRPGEVDVDADLEPSEVWGAGPIPDHEEGPDPAPSSGRRHPREPDLAPALRIVDVELIWIRYEFEGDLAGEHDPETEATTLSVCMVVSWPEPSLVGRAEGASGAAETLRQVIDVFEGLRKQELILSSRSRIEDGQFVGWLSYPDVVRAQVGFETLRDALSVHHLKVKLQTRDEPIPRGWRADRGSDQV